MSQWTGGNVEVCVVQRVEVAPATLVDSVKDVRPNRSDEDGDFVFHIDIVVRLCEVKYSVNNTSQTQSPIVESSSNACSESWSSRPFSV